MSAESTSSSSAAMAAVTTRAPDRASKPADRPTETTRAAAALKATAARACVALPLARRGSARACPPLSTHLHQLRVRPNAWRDPVCALGGAVNPGAGKIHLEMLGSKWLQ